MTNVPVRLAVTTKICDLGELLFAHREITRVRLLSRVLSYVHLQMVVTPKEFVAQFTLERLLARVNLTVILQHVLVAEGFFANIALEDFFISAFLSPEFDWRWRGI